MSFRFLYLAQDGPGNMGSCDFCGDTEIDDIIRDRPQERGLAWSDKQLRPMWQDTRPDEYGLRTCHKCLMDGTLDASEVETRAMREAMRT